MSRPTAPKAIDPLQLLSPKDRAVVHAGGRKRLRKVIRAARKGSHDGNPEPAARTIGLRYVTREDLTLRRIRKGKGFAFVRSNGKPVRDPRTVERLKHLAIPPAWTDVRLAADPAAHLQATGRDARKRLQYRYHPLWRTVREITKFHRMVPFGETLPAIRGRVQRDLAKPPLSRENMLAAVVRLLDRTLIRVGNDEYAEDNDSYGLTTMQNRHAEIRGGTISFRFKGKSGKRHAISLEDARLAKIVRKSRDLPGQRLFEYKDGDGKVRRVTSTDVNEYIRAAAGEGFTAKDFRTWGGTVQAALCLAACADADTKTARGKNIMKAVEDVSKTLGNTPAICRRSYVHPAVLQNYEAKMLARSLKRHRGILKRRRPSGLSLGEAAVLAFLKECGTG